MLNRLAIIAAFVMLSSFSYADTTNVNTTSNSTSNITTNNTSTNTNNNTNTSTNTNTNTNTNTSTSTSTSNNTNTSTTTESSTIDSTTNNTNNSTSKSTVDSTQTLKSPPASAIAPSIGASSSDICTTGVSGAVQTQILGIAAGATVRDLNCERLKISKTLYDMGMKVAAVSVMCQDTRVFSAMEMAGTPCPFFGKIGPEAQKGWDSRPELKPENVETEQRRNDTLKGAATGFGLAGLLMLLL